MAEAYIYDAVRTPRGKGKKDGSLYTITPLDLLNTVYRAVKDRNDLDTSYVEDAIMGCVSPVGEQGADIAKTAAIDSGYDNITSGVTLNRFCASGLEAVNQAAAYVMSGQVDLLLAGGVESMSRVPMGSDGGALFTSPEVIMKHKIVPQGISADLIATKYGYNRRQLDEFATRSHQKAAKAWAENRFNGSVIPVRDVNGTVVLDRDETVRPDTTADVLANLKPSFEIMGTQAGMDALALQRYPELNAINHVHHAGNSSGIVDGAAAVLIGSKEIGEKLGLKPKAKIRSFAVVGTEPTIMLVGPGPATLKALKKAGLSVNDIDLFEVNEAFAAVPTRFMEELGVSEDKVNVNGGAIAMGHPLGATGAILTGTLIDELHRQDKQFGVVTLCVGGGMGIATVFERV